ncbi:MAG: hypothetical protein ABEJ28_10775 [Salinigranum sp.]
MTDSTNPTDATSRSPGDDEQGTEETSWRHLPEADPIAVRDPLAELLGMVPAGEPLVITFPEVAKAAGHACPAVAGAYRGAQLALDELYDDAYPVRSEIRVAVGGAPDAPGFGPMAEVVRHVTGAADETGFAGFGGYGGRDGLLTFDPAIAGDRGRAFVFSRTDRDRSVRVTFDPGAVGDDPSDGPDPSAVLAKLVGGAASDDERKRFLAAWNGRVRSILHSVPGPESPFTLLAE